MKVLFICKYGESRSKTAADLFKKKIKTDYAGLSENRVTDDQLNWANIVVVMTQNQKNYVEHHFKKQLGNKKVISFEIPDVYGYNQLELKHLLKEKVSRLVLG